MRTFFSAALLAAGLLSPCAHPQQSDKLREDQVKAARGDVVAQRKLGTSYYYGNGVEKNLTEAVKWWRKAAVQGDAEAQFNVGACYYNGTGVEKNLTEGVEWYRRAAG